MSNPIEAGRRRWYAPQLSEAGWAWLILGVFFLVNLLVCTHTPIVFNDEVAYMEPVANFYWGTGFTSCLWGQDWHEFCATYVPLYDAMLIGFFKLFGFGFFQARALNVLLAGAGGWLVWRAMCNTTFIQRSTGRLLCLALVLSGSASTLAFRTTRPDAEMFFISAALLFACSLPNRRLQGVLVFAVSALLPAGGVPLATYVGILVVINFWIYRMRYFRLLALISSGMAAGLVLLLGFFASVGSLQSYLNFMVLPQTAVGHGRDMQFWHDRIFGQGPGDINILNLFFGNPWELYAKNTLFDHSAFLLFFLAVVLAWKLWAWADQPTRKATIYVLVTTLAIPPLLHCASHFFSYYRWMNYMPLTILVPRLLELCENHPFPVARRVGFWIICLSLFLGVPARTLAILPTWRERSHQPIELAAKAIIQPSETVVCDFKIYYAVRPHARQAFVYGCNTYGEFSLIKNLPTNDISLLILDPAGFKEVVPIVGGNWHKLPPEVVPGAERINATRYFVDFYRRDPK